ncbi:MAG: LacI family DNA-binding transcriptional regulator [Pseudomonadota bacterium]
MARTKKDPSLDTVAEMAGVSAMTVSRMLTKPEVVSPDTRERILAAMVRTGYVARKSTRTVGVLISSITNNTFASTIEGARNILSPAGYEVLLGDIGYSDQQAERVLAAILSKRPDGLIISSQDHTVKNRGLLSACRIPIVEVWDNPENPIDLTAGISHFEAGRLAAQHFIERDYVNLAYFGTRTPRDEIRWHGFQSVAGTTAKFIEAEPGQAAIHSFKSGKNVLDYQRDLGQPVAVFCSSEVLACGTIFRCQAEGIGIPEDIAICSFGDTPIAEAVFPALTSIRVPAMDMGAAAAQMVINRLTGKPSKTNKQLFKLELVVRATS